MDQTEQALAVELAVKHAGIDRHTAGSEVIGLDRGVFSTVYRVADGERSAAVKLPRPGPNGDAARASGAYDRERIAYADLLTPECPAPHCFGIEELGHGPAFVLQDLSSFPAVDQLDGLSASQAVSLIDPLFEAHSLLPVERATELGVRSATPAGFDPNALARGLSLVPNGAAFERLLAERLRRVQDFADLADPVVCHGDPRADNVVLGPAPVLFDWQQLSIQAGEADLAWLAATSLEPRIRRVCEVDLVARYSVRTGRSFDQTWDRYTKAMIVPGLAVLLLAQRRATGRLAELVRTSVERIATATTDLLI